MISKYHFIEYLENSPPIIELIWLSIGVFFVSIIVLTVYLKFLRSHLRQNERILDVYHQKYELHLITYLYSGNAEDVVSPEQQTIINKLKKDLSDPFKRGIVVTTLLKLKDEISGEMDASIQRLYIQTGLVDFAKSSLKSKKWHVVATGVRELTQFHIEEVKDQVAELIEHPRSEVRKEMQLYFVNLFSFKGLDFLNILQTPLSEWDQIQLLEVLQRFDDQQSFDIKLWLQSSNDSVVIFALKLADIYIQFQAKEQLLELLSHPNEKIRIDVINVLSNLNVIEAKNILKSNFHERSEEEQIVFLKLMENMPEGHDEAFLLENIRHKNFEIKFSALKTLKLISPKVYVIQKQIPSGPDFDTIVNFLESN